MFSIRGSTYVFLLPARPSLLGLLDRNMFGFLVFFVQIPSMIFGLYSNLLPFRNPDPGSHRGHSSLLRLPTTVRAFVFMARKVLHLLPSPTSVDLFMHPLGTFCSRLLYKKSVLLEGGSNSRNKPHELRDSELQGPRGRRARQRAVTIRMRDTPNLKPPFRSARWCRAARTKVRQWYQPTRYRPLLGSC